jgi:hypothetical protein
MSRNESRVTGSKLPRSAVRGILVLVLVGLLVVPTIVQADLKATNVAYGWDYRSQAFENGNVAITFTGQWVSFWHELYFDTDAWADACGVNTSTRWAGNMYYGLYHLDIDGARGFQATRNWSLVDCDRDGDGDFDVRDLRVAPQTHRVLPAYAECSETSAVCNLSPANQDVVTGCTTGNCASEIVTTFFINLDTDCNGSIDVPLPTAGLCFYAEALTPLLAPGESMWGGNVQARISTVGGEKTVNFSVEPTAIDLASFTAKSQGDDVLLAWETANELDNLGFHLYRATSSGGQKTRLNKRLIPSQMPGSVIGATYTFWDRTAEPGRAYYYWLEDVDVQGVATLNGPVSASTPPVKVLPGRPRPAPAPGLAR